MYTSQTCYNGWSHFSLPADACLFASLAMLVLLRSLRSLPADACLSASLALLALLRSLRSLPADCIPLASLAPEQTTASLPLNLIDSYAADLTVQPKSKEVGHWYVLQFFNGSIIL